MSFSDTTLTIVKTGKPHVYWGFGAILNAKGRRAHAQ